MSRYCRISAQVSPRRPFDHVLVGGGLANTLIALALAKAGRGARVALVERGATLGGNHLWCFHAGDVTTDDAKALVDPLVASRWDGYDVRFPSYERTVDEPYAAVSSDKLDAVARATLEAAGTKLFLGRSTTAVRGHEVDLDDGTTLCGEAVLDGRGPETLARSSRSGWQKFVGLELRIDPARMPARPVVMDARVDQTDGYRFVYVLPLSRDRVLVEDTVFSDDPALDRDLFRARALAYAARTGLISGAAVIDREEEGVLAMPLALEPQRVGLPLRTGYGGGWFHPTTGYSFPCAVRLALHVAKTPVHDLAGRDLVALRREHDAQQRYALLLNRLLFAAAEPALRFTIFERFYRLPAPVVRRFYALATTPFDRARILVGRPPRGVSIGKAVSELLGIPA